MNIRRILQVGIRLIIVWGIIGILITGTKSTMISVTSAVIGVWGTYSILNADFDKKNEDGQIFEKNATTFFILLIILAIFLALIGY